MTSTNKLATAIRPPLFAVDFSTGAFITTLVGDVRVMICGSVRLLNVRVTHPQPNQRGDPDSCWSRFEGSVLAPVPSNGTGWLHLLLTSAETSERDTHQKKSLLQKCCIKFANLVCGRRSGFIQGHYD